MSGFFLTLVSSQTLSAGHRTIVFDFLKNQGIAFTEEWYVLSPDRAVDIALQSPLNKTQIDALRGRLNHIDVFVSPAANRRKKLFIADMDSTIVTSETLDELAAFANVKNEVSAITKLSMEGKINFEESLTKRVALLENMDAKHMQTILENTKFNPGADILLKTLRKNNVHCVLVSGGFTFFTSQIAKKIEFDTHHGNVLDIQNGALTGKLAAPILGPSAKLDIMKEYLQDMEIGADDVLAIGDGANDIHMLEAAGLGVGYYPKPILAEKLLNQIRHTDLQSLLYLQGYDDEGVIPSLEQILD